MYEGSGKDQVAAQYQGNGSGRIAGANQTAVERPRLANQLDQLEKVLSVCHDVASNLEGAADRILGPLPQDASKEPPQPPRSTVEQRLQEVIRVTELLANRLGNASQRLNTAV